MINKDNEYIGRVGAVKSLDMEIIRFTGWKKGMNKIKFILLLRSHTELSLRQAKSTKDRIVDGEIIEIHVKSDIAHFIVDQSGKLGVYAAVL